MASAVQKLNWAVEEFVNEMVLLGIDREVAIVRAEIAVKEVLARG